MPLGSRHRTEMTALFLKMGDAVECRGCCAIRCADRRVDRGHVAQTPSPHQISIIAIAQAREITHMRQGQNHQKRPRGRGGRKPHNMTNRTFDSNGPDVKIRGTASHIYEKYLQLARDAQSSGDRIQGENYLQHAEHYWRVLVATQPPGQPYQPGGYGPNGEQRQNGGQGGYGVPGEGPQPDFSGRQNGEGQDMNGEEGEDEGDDEGDGEEMPRA